MLNNVRVYAQDTKTIYILGNNKAVRSRELIISTQEIALIFLSNIPYQTPQMLCKCYTGNTYKVICMNNKNCTLMYANLQRIRLRDFEYVNEICTHNNPT